MKLKDEFFGNEHYVSEMIKQINTKIELEEAVKQRHIQEKTCPTAIPIEFKILSADYTRSYSGFFIILWLILFCPIAIFMILANFLKKPKLVMIHVSLTYADGTQEIRSLSYNEWIILLNEINKQAQERISKQDVEERLKQVQEEILKKAIKTRSKQAQEEKLIILNQSIEEVLKQAQEKESKQAQQETLEQAIKNSSKQAQDEKLIVLNQSIEEALKQAQEKESKQAQQEKLKQAIKNRSKQAQDEKLIVLNQSIEEVLKQVQEKESKQVQEEILKQAIKNRPQQVQDEKLITLNQSIEEVLKQTQEKESKKTQEEISKKTIEVELKAFKKIIEEISKKNQEDKLNQIKNSQQEIKTNVSPTLGSNGISTINKLNYKQKTEEISTNDGFGTFKNVTNFDRESKTTSNKTKGQWVNENEQRIINGRKVNRGLFYFGGVIESLSGDGTEPSLVDESYPVTPINTDTHEELNIYTDESLGYWPSYASLSSKCKGAYLDWLASNRTNPDTPIGYIFIYFYGLERRIIENRTNSTVSDAEFLIIFDEVLRLNKIFKDSRSFNQYSANFLELMILLRHDLLDPRIGELPNTYNALSFKVKLAKTIYSEQFVGADLAFDWLKNTFDYSFKMPARRCEDEFRQLFKIRFTQKFGSGIAVKPNKTKLQLLYHPASNGIHGVELSVEDLPDPSVLKSPIKKFIPIAELCSEELSGFSRYLSKSNTSKDDIAALMLLPQELADTSNSPVIKSFKKWVEHTIQSNEGLTTVKEFWSHTAMPIPKAINKKESDLLIALATKANVGIAPDPQIHQEKFKLDGNLVLFSPGYGLCFEPSQEFNRVNVAIKLGAMIATTDGCVDDNEKSALQRLIEHDNKLSQTEKNSLKAYLIWCLSTPTNAIGLKAKIEQFKSSEIEFLKTFMVSIALSDGNVDSAEIKQIEKLYTVLGLDKSLVTSDIHNLTSTKKPIPISLNDKNAKTDIYELDYEILAIHESDTSDAKKILESIFVVDDDVEIATVEKTESDGLDQAHKDLFELLLNKEKWQRDEVYDICKKLNLMLDGAIETINNWAYEKVDAPVLDDDGDIYIDLEIVEELKG